MGGIWMLYRCCMDEVWIVYGECMKIVITSMVERADFEGFW